MYVTTKPFPALASDHNIPPLASTALSPGAEVRDGLLVVGDKPVVSRTFLPDCGPAAVAVGLPGGQCYCFDAGTCHLRYAWRGGFVDNTDQWAGKGDLWSQVVGRIYFRAPVDGWLRLGSPGRIPAARWHGYRLVGDFPQFLYTLDGVEVRQLIRSNPKGSGLEISYEIPEAQGSVSFVFDPESGAKVEASTGSWKGPILTLTSVEARHFTITLTERPGIEPLGYWSMNDALWSSETSPQPGVVGRAFTPGGMEATPRVLDSGISANQLSGGGTLMAWAKVPAGEAPAPVFSAGPAFLVSPSQRDNRWHQIVLTFPPAGGSGHLFVDGSDCGASALRLPRGDIHFEIGSAAGRFLPGLLDEVRIYDRLLSADEIKATYRREAAVGNLLPK
jgi:hypothetical protein